MAAAAESFDSSVYEANLVTVLPQDVIDKLAELDLELSEGKDLTNLTQSMEYLKGLF
jgi:hypothetical protein